MMFSLGFFALVLIIAVYFWLGGLSQQVPTRDQVLSTSPEVAEKPPSAKDLSERPTDEQKEIPPQSSHRPIEVDKLSTGNHSGSTEDDIANQPPRPVELSELSIPRHEEINNLKNKDKSIEEPSQEKPKTKSDLPKSFTNSLWMEFVLVPSGSFMRGNNERKSEQPIQQVNINEPFFLQTTEVTQSQWKAVMGENPSYWDDCSGDCPVENVSWDDVHAFLTRLNQMENGQYRLPTEAEWEYAARSGGKNQTYSGGEDLEDLAWYRKNSGGVNRGQSTYLVGRKKPNGLGLYDMSGNVWEWVEDDWHDSYEGAPVIGRAWIDDPRDPRRVIRGGGARDDANSCRSAARNFYWAEDRSGFLGFRLCRSVAQSSPATEASPGRKSSRTAGQVEKQSEEFTPIESPRNKPYEKPSDETARNTSAPQKSFTNSFGMEFALVPAGSFMMGDHNDNDYIQPLHRVTFQKPFYIQTTELTQGQWKAVMGDDPFHYDDCEEDCPVNEVSWDDAQTFMNRLNRLKGNGYRLPTEAEWEYAARSGGKNQTYSGGGDLDKLGWCGGRNRGYRHPVGQKEPNGLGLYDMSGNVWEWVEDYWHDNYEGAPTDGSAWVKGPGSSLRVVRGGSYSDHEEHCRSYFRHHIGPGSRWGLLGFRLAKSIEP